MMSNYEKMELCFKDPEQFSTLSADENWRVRYAAAVGMGEHGSEKWIPFLEKMLELEGGRPLYSQPQVSFINSTDDTRMAEHIGPIEVVFDAEYSYDLKEAWACRGRVKLAVAYAVYKIGSATSNIIAKLCEYLDKSGEDYCVKAAAAKALGVVGNRDIIPYLERATVYDEWCTQTEAKKAISQILSR